MASLWYTELRSILRRATSSPGFTLAVTLLLALGLGINAVTFSLVDRLVVRGPESIESPNELRQVAVHSRNRSGAAAATMSISYADYRDFLIARQLAGAAAESGSPLLLGTGNAAELIKARLVTANYFELLGARPHVGRFFTAQESEQEGARLMVLSHAFWTRRFAGDLGVLGRAVPVGAHTYTIIGVAPRRFTGSSVGRTDAFLPLESAADEIVSGNWRSGRNFTWMTAVVRLAPGTSTVAAENEITVAYREEHRDDPSAELLRLEFSPLTAMRGAAAAPERGIAALMAALAVVVFAIAISNVTNLFLARSLRRRSQLAVCLALGSTRRRLVVESAAEGVLLALMGTAAAAFIAGVFGGTIQARLFPEVEWSEAALNWRAIALVAACAVLGGGVAAAIPAWQVGRGDLASALRTGAARSATHRTRGQSAMLVVQSALSVMLLVGAGLFIRSFAMATTLDLGFDSERLIVVASRHGAVPPHRDFAETLRERSARLPGVERTALVSGTMPFMSNWAPSLRVPGITESPRMGPFIHAVTPGYFETVGTDIVEGRAFDEYDTAGGSHVAIVNQSMAKFYWPGQSAIGKCLEIGGGSPTCARVVGIAENTRRWQIVEGETLMYYVPAEQAAASVRAVGPFLIMRASSASYDVLAQIAESVRREALSLEPSLRSVSAQPLDDIISPQLRSWRTGATVFTSFGVLAMIIAAAGLYSVVAFDVEGRRKEIGLRSALGAERAEIVRHILMGGLRLTTIGVISGLVLAWLGAPAIEPLLYGVAAHDASTFWTAAIALLSAGIAAAAVPAIIATRIPVSEALRGD